MSYVALRFDTCAEAADAWADALLATGALSVDVSDPAAGTPAETPVYAEPDEPGSALWPIARISALFDAGVDAGTVLRTCAASVGAAPPLHETHSVAEQDWVRATQAQFGPIRIAEGFWIVPSWCEPPDPQALNLALDPGLAFGTGSHPTTRLCLEWLREHAGAQSTLLDYGCGSGILAIAAAKLGARRVAGTDVDPQALRASAANAQANGVVATFVAPAALPPETFDIVVANILTNPLVVLAPVLARRVRAGGRIALAGLRSAQAAAVASAYARWFTIATWRTDEGWSLLAGVRTNNTGHRAG